MFKILAPIRGKIPVELKHDLRKIANLIFVLANQLSDKALVFTPECVSYGVRFCIRSHLAFVFKNTEISKLNNQKIYRKKKQQDKI